MPSVEGLQSPKHPVYCLCRDWLCRLVHVCTHTNTHAHTHSDMCRLAEKYNALVFLDECHATGFLGDTGRYLRPHPLIIIPNNMCADD